VLLLLVAAKARTTKKLLQTAAGSAFGEW